MTIIAALLVAILVTLTGGAAGWVPRAHGATGEYGDRLQLSLSSITPMVINADSPNHLTLRGQYTNTGPDPIDGIAFRFQRGDALDTADKVQDYLARPVEPTAVLTEFRNRPETLQPGESFTFQITVPISGRSPQSLAIPTAGVYPVMLNVNGTVTTEGGTIDARVGELYFVTTVQGLPGHYSEQPTPSNVAVVWPMTDRPHLGVGGIFLDDELAESVSDGGRLHQQLTAIEKFDASGTDPELLTLLIDPMLLDELDRMTNRYWVRAVPGHAQPSLLDAPVPADHADGTEGAAPGGGDQNGPDQQGPGQTGSPEKDQPDGTAPGTGGDAAATQNQRGGASHDSPATSDGGTADVPGTVSQSAEAGVGGDDPDSPDQEPPDTDTPATPDGAPAAPDGTVAGEGSVAATVFLTRLRAVAARHDVIVLPYGDADVSGLARAGRADVIRSAVRTGSAVAHRVLPAGREAAAISDHLLTSVAAPPDGAITPAALAALQKEGITSALLSEDAVIPAGSADEERGDGLLQVRPADAASIPVLLTGGSDAALLRDALAAGLPDPSDVTAASAAAAQMLLTMPHLQKRMVILLPRGTDYQGANGDEVLSPSQLGGFAEYVAQLAQDSFIAPASVRTQLSRGQATPISGELHYPDTAAKAELPGSYFSRIKKVEADLADLAQSLLQADGGPDPDNIVTPLRDAMLSAVSSCWRGSNYQRIPVVQTAEITIRQIYQSVRLTSDDSYTLASSAATLPMTVHNSLPYDVGISVHIIGGDAVGLTMADPGVLRVQAGPRITPITLDTSVSRSGTFAVQVQMVSATGVEWGSTQRVTIDSRAYGGLTIALMVIAGGVLLLMVLWRIVQRIRGTAADPANERVDEADLDGDAEPSETPPGNPRDQEDVIPTEGQGI